MRISSHCNCIKPLLDAGVDASLRDANGETALDIARKANYTEAIAALNKDSVDIAGQTPLHYASEGNLGSLERLLEAGADTDRVDKAGRTPLHTAAMHSQNCNCIKPLLDAGADASLRDFNGETALDIARELNNTGAIAALSACVDRAD
eukprot:PRCOL_00006821-RA